MIIVVIIFVSFSTFHHRENFIDPPGLLLEYDRLSKTINLGFEWLGESTTYRFARMEENYFRRFYMGIGD